MARRKTHKQYWKLSSNADRFKLDADLMETGTRIRLMNDAGSNIAQVTALQQGEIATIERLNRQFSRRRQAR